MLGDSPNAKSIRGCIEPINIRDYENFRHKYQIFLFRQPLLTALVFGNSEITMWILKEIGWNQTSPELESMLQQARNLMKEYDESISDDFEAFVTLLLNRKQVELQ